MNDRSNAKSTAIILIVLLFLAIVGFIGCIAFGMDVNSYYIAPSNYQTGTMAIADTGSNGGAIGCGIFGAAALLAFVKVFLAKTN